ncbi:unnamed protein product, partial [Amoebophrya sp. A25]
KEYGSIYTRVFRAGIQKWHDLPMPLDTALWQTAVCGLQGGAQETAQTISY